MTILMTLNLSVAAKQCRGGYVSCGGSGCVAPQRVCARDVKCPRAVFEAVCNNSESTFGRVRLHPQPCLAHKTNKMSAFVFHAPRSARTRQFPCLVDVTQKLTPIAASCFVTPCQTSPFDGRLLFNIVENLLMNST